MAEADHSVPEALARLCADLAYEQKGEDIVVLDVDRILVITGYFVLVTGTTRKHLQGIADAITRELRERGVPRLSSEGYDEGQWVLLDFADVIVQLFDPESRRRYNLEEIWADAPRLDWKPKLPGGGDADSP